MHDVVLITVTFNSASTLKAHWGNAPELGIPWIVVDNNSSDGSADVARQLGAAQVIVLPRNVGFSAANNVAASVVDAACYLFVNPDVTVTGPAARQLAATAVRESALAAPQLLNSDGSMQENGRTSPYLYRKVLHYLAPPGRRLSYEVRASVDEVKEVSWVIGAAVAIPRDIFHKLRGWDSTFFVYYEDSDICLRARCLGHRVLLVGSVTWLHSWARETKRKRSVAAARLEFKAGSQFYRRYLGLLLHPVFFRRSSAAVYKDVSRPLPSIS